MDAAIITALAAVSGSIVGGLASFATTYFTQRNQAHRDFLSRDVAHREELYSQFIKETTNLYADSLDKTLTNPTSLIGMYSLVGRIRLLAGDKVLSAAEKLTETIVDSYSRPPIKFEEVYKVWFAKNTLIRSRSSLKRAEMNASLCSSVYRCGNTFEHGHAVTEKLVDADWSKYKGSSQL